MKYLTLFSALMGIAMPSLADAAIAVYPGCTAPVPKASRHTFYVDPLHGSQNGDGSAAKPWHTLAEVLAPTSKFLSTSSHNSRTWKNGDTSLSVINPQGPIKAGDIIMLKSGNHGDVAITDMYNSDFVTVMAAPGATPLLSSLKVVSSAKWIFQGLKIQGANPVKNSTTNLVSFGRGDWIGSTSDIILDSSSLSTTEDTSKWTDSDWQNKPDSYLVVLYQGEKCLALTNSHLYNGQNGVQLGSDSSLVQGNLFERMYNDGIDFLGSNQLIKQNTVQNGVNNYLTSQFHPDGIQGWSLISNGKPLTNTNDVIDSNYIIKTGNGNLTQMQGISIFDGNWDKLQIINNVVVSNVYHGIAVYGGNNVSILNNTVIASDPNYSTWILANTSKSGQPGNNVVVRNNLASNLIIGYPGVTFDHNIVGSMIQTKDAGKTSTVKSGTVGNANKISSSFLSGFVTASASTTTYDLRLRTGSPAVGAGTPSSAPPIDLAGRKRSAPVDAGAYQH